MQKRFDPHFKIKKFILLKKSQFDNDKRQTKCFLLMSSDNVLSVKDNAEDEKNTGYKIGIITKLMVLRANGNAQRI